MWGAGWKRALPTEVQTVAPRPGVSKRARTMARTDEAKPLPRGSPASLKRGRFELAEESEEGDLRKELESAAEAKRVRHDMPLRDDGEVVLLPANKVCLGVVWVFGQRRE
jgi:hypothetical protein